MSKVIKRINGRDYYYYQTSLGTRMKPVTTYICAVRSNVIKLSESSASSLLNHMVKLFDENALLEQVDYTFKHRPSNPDYNIKTLEYIRALYKIIKENLPEYHDLEQAVFVKYIHCSNAIEGNSLSRSQVYDFLYKDKSPLGKSYNELLQTRNHFEVKKYLDRYKGEINGKLIKKIHQIMMDGVDGYNDENKSGVYRKDMVKINGGNARISKPEDIQMNIQKIIQEYHSMLKANIHPIDCMAVFHSMFERIHPFRDGNGRTGRAILDYMLRIHGFAPVYFPRTEHDNYMKALRECGFENYTPLVDLLIIRMMMTFWFIASRSTMYHAMISSEYRSFFISHFGSEQLHDHLIGFLKYQRENDDDP